MDALATMPEGGIGDVLLSVVGRVAPQLGVPPSQVQQATATRIHGLVWWANRFGCRLGALPRVGEPVRLMWAEVGHCSRFYASRNKPHCPAVPHA